MAVEEKPDIHQMLCSQPFMPCLFKELYSLHSIAVIASLWLQHMLELVL